MELNNSIIRSETLKNMGDVELFDLASDLLNGVDSKSPNYLNQKTMTLAKTEYTSNTDMESMFYLSRDVYKECAYRLLKNKS